MLKGFQPLFVFWSGLCVEARKVKNGETLGANGKWKQYIADAFGRSTQVQATGRPRPGGFNAFERLLGSGACRQVFMRAIRYRPANVKMTSGDQAAMTAGNWFRSPTCSNTVPMVQ
jgi:hypothetical protein